MRTMLYQWLRLNSLSVVAMILLIAGCIMFVVGARTHDDTWKTVGGIVLGSVLTVVVGALTGREAVHQQYAKEANLRRKTDSYGPLHEEMKALREALDAAQAGRTPYPRRIAVDPLRRYLPWTSWARSIVTAHVCARGPTSRVITTPTISRRQPTPSSTVRRRLRSATTWP